MPRKSQVRYWSSRKGGGFFTTIDGVQHELALGPDDSKQEGPVYREAVAKWVDLVCQQEPADKLTVRGLINLYRDHDDEQVVRVHRQKAISKLRSFVDLHGEVRVRDLLPLHVTSWFKSRPTWGPTTKNTAGNRLLSALNWAVKEGYLPVNPLDGRLSLPRPRSRGKEARLTDELMDLIEQACWAPCTRLFFRLLRLTGARPVELAEATADRYRDGWIVHPWNPSEGYRHKTAKKTERDRIIYLPDGLVGDVEELTRRYPSGPIFRTRRGRNWTNDNVSRSWNGFFRRPAVADYVAAHGLDRAHLTPYCYRHTFISAWCDSGKNLHVCASICGTSVKMIERVYGHPDARKIHEQYRAFLAGR